MNMTKANFLVMKSKDEEQRIKDVLSHLSRALPEMRVSDFNSMAASKDILFWISSGQLLRNKRTIPVTNIAELVEDVLLPHTEQWSYQASCAEDVSRWTCRVRNR